MLPIRDWLTHGRTVQRSERIPERFRGTGLLGLFPA
jgi:hypothetical protein